MYAVMVWSAISFFTLNLVFGQREESKAWEIGFIAAVMLGIVAAIVWFFVTIYNIFS